MAFEDQIIVFMTNMSASLGRIEEALDNTKSDLKEVKATCANIPEIESGLNNHLKTHDRIKNRFFYPVGAGVAIVVILTLLKTLKVL